MYGKNVYVTFREKLREVFVLCTPSTTKDELEHRATRKLEMLEQKYKNDFEWAYYGMKKGYNV